MAASHPTRPGRALIGWMAAGAAEPLLAGGPTSATVGPAEAARARAAREAVAGRGEGVDQRGLVTALPEALTAHLAAIGEDPAVAELLAGGWEPRLVDLARLVAVQLQIHTDEAEQRVAGLDADDLAAIAAVCLPQTDPSDVAVQFDPTRNAWIFSGANPNLQVLSRFNGRARPGTAGAGFVVGVAPSLVQVAQVGGRLVLRDGYHRAYGLLRRGITRVPALVREFGTVAELGLSEPMLAPEIFLGERPPLLSDYLDDTVAADVLVPATRKVVVVQALELNPMG